MKKTLILTVLCFSTSVMMAGNVESIQDYELVDSIKENSDTSHFFLGRHEIIVSDCGNDIHFIRNRFSDTSEEGNIDYAKRNPFLDFNSHWSSINFGLGGFGSEMFSTSVGSGQDYIDVDPLRSFAFHWNISDIALPLTSSKNLGIVTGVGVSWDYYALSNKSISLRKGDTALVYFVDSVEFKRNKLRTCNLVVPLMFEIHPTKSSDLYVMLGVEGNLRLGAKNKQVTEEGKKNKYKSDFYMNPITCNFVVRAGYEDFGVFFSTACTPMFKDGKGPNIYPFSAGVSMNF